MVLLSILCRAVVLVHGRSFVIIKPGLKTSSVTFGRLDGTIFGSFSVLEGWRFLIFDVVGMKNVASFPARWNSFLSPYGGDVNIAIHRIVQMIIVVVIAA